MNEDDKIKKYLDECIKQIYNTSIGALDSFIGSLSASVTSQTDFRFTDNFHVTLSFFRKDLAQA